MNRPTALITWDFLCRTFFNQFSFQKYFASQYQKPILIWFVLPSGQTAVLGDIDWRVFAPHTVSIPLHTTMWTMACKRFFSDTLGCPSSISFWEWSLSLTFHKHSMKTQTLLVCCDKQKVSHLPWNEFKIFRFDSSKNFHSHWVLHHFTRKPEYNLWCPLVPDKTWLQQRSSNICLCFLLVYPAVTRLEEFVSLVRSISVTKSLFADTNSLRILSNDSINLPLKHLLVAFTINLPHLN